MSNDPWYSKILFDQLRDFHLNQLSETVCKEDNWGRIPSQESNRAYTLRDRAVFNLENHYETELLKLVGLFNE